MKFTIDDDINLKKIAESGQCFRWEELPIEYAEMDTSIAPLKLRYRIPVGDKCLVISDDGNGEFTLDCSEDEMNEYWSQYFDLCTSYRNIRKAINKDEDSFLYDAAEYCEGIRILQQDPWETLISFIISQNRNIPAIKQSIERLCTLAGKKLHDSEGRTFYSFPSADQILRLTDDEFSSCKLGYRDVYIKSAAKEMLKGRIDFDRLIKLDADSAIVELMRLKGVGPKVANCVALFGLHHLDAFPIDVWIKKVLANEYPKGYPQEKYSPYNGVYQQYMFAYYRGKVDIDRE